MKANRSIPSATVIPVLIYPDVREAVAWLTASFGFIERVKIGEGHRSQMRVGDPAGHQRTFSETVADVAPTAWGGTLLEGEGTLA